MTVNNRPANHIPNDILTKDFFSVISIEPRLTAISHLIIAICRAAAITVAVFVFTLIFFQFVLVVVGSEQLFWRTNLGRGGIRLDEVQVALRLCPTQNIW